MIYRRVRTTIHKTDWPTAIVSWDYMGGAAGWARVGHGPPKILGGWATMHLAHPIIGLYVR